MGKKPNKPDTRLGTKAALDVRRTLVAQALADGDVRAQQVNQWLGNLSFVCADIRAKGEASSYLPIFWIRLHGVIWEYRPRLSSGLRDASANTALSALIGNAAVFAQEQLKICDEIVSVFTEEELVYIDYRRNVECHIHQDHYRHRPGERVDGIPISLKPPKNVLGEDGFSVEKLRRHIRKVLDAHGSEPALALAFVRKIHKLVDQLYHHHHETLYSVPPRG